MRRAFAGLLSLYWFFMSIPLPEPLNVDTDLSEEVGATGMDAPDIDNFLPVASMENFQQATFNGPTGPFGFAEMMKRLSGDTDGQPDFKAVPGGGGRQDVVAFAKKFLGMNYKWGGSNPSTSFDCSGFIQYVLGKFGVQAPRVSFQQAQMGKRIGLNELSAGDLVAWDNSSRNNGADHIALYIGNGQIMEFYRTGKPSRIRKIGKDEGAWGVQINYGKG